MTAGPRPPDLIRQKLHAVLQGIHRRSSRSIHACQHARNGNGWVVGQWPALTRAGSALVAVDSGSQDRWFDASGSPTPTFTPRFDSQDTLDYVDADDGSGTKEYVLTDTRGNQTRYYDFDDGLPALQRGAFKSFRDAAGNRIRAYAHDADGALTEVRRSATTGGVTTTEAYVYTYITGPGADRGLLGSVVLRRSTNGTTFTPVRQAEYAYYDGSYTGDDAYGNAGDLKTATVEDESGNPLDVRYYRYYVPGDTNGFVGGLKYVFTPEGYARLAANLTGTTTPLTATDT